ncbi:MAG: hypothetical protein RR860_05625, partial [Janthinobacterium sp.]
QDLTLSQQRGPSRTYRFEEGLTEHLRQVYRRSYERLARENRVEEAVFVLAELLEERREALDYLEKHARYQQAADLALAWRTTGGRPLSETNSDPKPRVWLNLEYRF